LSVRYIQNQLDKVAELKNITTKHSPHNFRKLINEEREKKGVAPIDRTILLNHTPQSIEARNYLPSLKQIQDLKKIYDKTFLSQYLNIKMNRIDSIRF